MGEQYCKYCGHQCAAGQCDNILCDKQVRHYCEACGERSVDGIVYCLHCGNFFSENPRPKVAYYQEQSLDIEEEEIEQEKPTLYIPSDKKGKNKIFEKGIGRSRIKKPSSASFVEEKKMLADKGEEKQWIPQHKERKQKKLAVIPKVEGKSEKTICDKREETFKKATALFVPRQTDRKITRLRPGEHPCNTNNDNVFRRFIPCEEKLGSAAFRLSKLVILKKYLPIIPSPLTTGHFKPEKEDDKQPSFASAKEDQHSLETSLAIPERQPLNDDVVPDQPVSDSIPVSCVDEKGGECLSTAMKIGSESDFSIPAEPVEEFELVINAKTSDLHTEANPDIDEQGQNVVIQSNKSLVPAKETVSISESTENFSSNIEKDEDTRSTQNTENVESDFILDFLNPMFGAGKSMKKKKKAKSEQPKKAAVQISAREKAQLLLENCAVPEKSTGQEVKPFTPLFVDEDLCLGKSEEDKFAHL